MTPDGEKIGRAMRSVASHRDDGVDGGAATTRRAIAQGLRHTDGPVTASDLAQALDLHSNTVRNHLESLANDGLVTRSQVRTGGRGRPSTVYAPVLDALFPLDELAQELSHMVAGDDVTELAKQSVQAWLPRSERTAPAATVDEAVEQAVEALRDVGFEASHNTIGDEITMSGCPYAPLVSEHPEICAIHSELINNVLTASAQPVELGQVEVWVRPGVCRAHLLRSDVTPAFTIPGPSTSQRKSQPKD